MSSDNMEQKLKNAELFRNSVNEKLKSNPANAEWLQKLSDIVTTSSQIDSDDEEANEAKGFFKCEDCSYWFNPEKDNMYILNYKHSHKILMEERTICSDCFDTWGESYKKDGWKCDDFEDESENLENNEDFFKCEDCDEWVNLEFDNVFCLSKKNIERNICHECFETFKKKYIEDGWECDNFEDEDDDESR
jgi:hypothetical protein